MHTDRPSCGARTRDQESDPNVVRYGGKFSELRVEGGQGSQQPKFLEFYPNRTSTCRQFNFCATGWPLAALIRCAGEETDGEPSVHILCVVSIIRPDHGLSISAYMNAQESILSLTFATLPRERAAHSDSVPRLSEKHRREPRLFQTQLEMCYGNTVLLNWTKEESQGHRPATCRVNERVSYTCATLACGALPFRHFDVSNP